MIRSLSTLIQSLLIDLDPPIRPDVTLNYFRSVVNDPANFSKNFSTTQVTPWNYHFIYKQNRPESQTDSYKLCE